MQNEYWHEVSPAEAKPGDILVRPNHVEMVAASNPSATCTTDLRHFNFGSKGVEGQGPSMIIHEIGHCSEFQKIFALNEDVQVTPSGSVPASDDLLEEENNATEDPADEFYYQGLAQGSFSGSKSTNLLAWLFNLISQLVDYVLGFMTMIIKVVIIGWANIFVNIITESLDALTGEAVEEPVEDENKNTNTNETAQTNVVTSETAEEPQSILDSDNLYTPSSTELQPEGDDKLTIDKIIFNQIPLLDVNMFSDTAGGYKLKEDSSLQIIRDSVATWYYAIRNITIAIMLVVLIYIGIKIAISSIASEKAEYKRMLVSWLVGFLIIFVIHFFLIFVLNLNSTILGWIMDAQESMGYEDSIYETVRTKAYEIKLSAGMTGTILYIVLIVLMLKFLYIYLKRLLGVCILIIMAPMMGASYAISKVRTGKAKAFSRWMKDYTLLVLIQSVHALIYTCFVTVVLKLTNESMAGIMIALIVMNFMFKATNIFTGIFSMVGEKDGGSRSLDTILKSSPRKEVLGTMFVAGEIGKSIKGMAGGAVQFGKDLKRNTTSRKEKRKQAQLQALGYGNLGKKALGKSWLGTKNIDAATGQFVPKGKAEKLTSLSEDLNKETLKTRENRRKSRRKFVQDLYSIHDRRMTNALKIATALPLMGISGFEELGAANIASVLLGGGENNSKKKEIKKPKIGLKRKLSNLRRNGVVNTAKTAVRNKKTDIKENMKDKVNNDFLKPTAKIYDTYEERMAKINEAKGEESDVIDLYKKGRRSREKEFEGFRAQGKTDKEIKQKAKDSFNESYRRTVEDVFSISDIVDERIDREKHLQPYKDELGIDDKTIGKNSINTVKRKVQQQVKNNISDKLREQYSRDNNYQPLDEVTKQKIAKETEMRVSKFMKDLDKEVDDRTDKDEKLANDPYVIKGDRFDFSETINADELKSTIEDLMKKHDANKRAEKGMEELREHIQKLQRIDREYANLESNKEGSYLYRTSTNIHAPNDEHSNLKNVLTSLTFRNIDIDGERR